IHRRTELTTTIQPNILEEYERIRTFHTDAAVKVRRNCCSGCFSAVPPQKLVEMRTKLDLIFTCEHCGRILITDGM
ncbi:MAG TPA: C4-type zinc ribbon domain-containing protein, partial [Candidatus Kapabacteria bacterium]|nr:C4-type zinc ribbon domain-containing protein [Candidatus Kapabacteria bacterium]